MDDALAYAQEVYAACRTVGFDGESVALLKHLIDAAENQARSPVELVQAAQRAHLEAADWAARL